MASQHSQVFSEASSPRSSSSDGRCRCPLARPSATRQTRRRNCSNSWASPTSVTHLTYTFNGNSDRPYVSFIVHFAFSIAFAIIYCVLAERFPQIKLWQGAAFGIFVYVAFHVVLMPLMGTVPAPWNQPFAEHFSEFFGHIIWLWVIEVFRRDMRNRITHEPDAEFPLEARTN